jgi:zinc protease
MFKVARILATFAFPLVAAAALWPEVHSDLPSDPALHSGALPNGLRYLILPNAEPKDRISLRLLVAVGSLHEADDELGLAHFVEHMAFRSTRTHPDGSLTPALQRVGLGLGPDSAAFTSYDNTIYHLELPDAKETTLTEGLRVLREFAEEVTFDAQLIERERGVILSEKATRDTPDARASLANLEFLWPKSRHRWRTVGGTEAAIRSFTRPQFVAFYDAWYRPERMAVIIVGNVGPVTAEKLVAAILGPLAGRGPPRPEPTDLVPVEAAHPDVAIFSDPGIVGVGLTFEHPLSTPRTEDSHAQRVLGLHRALAFAMFHNRLQKIAHEPGASFVTPTATLAPSMPEWQTASLSVGGKIDDWRQVAAEVEQEHRRAFRFGFTATELKETKAGFATAYEESVRTAPTWPSGWIANRLAGCLLSGTVFVAPTDLERDLSPDLAAATLEDCQREFREVWTAQAPHVIAVANPAFRITREQIGAALNQSRRTDVTPREERAPLPAFAYTEVGPPGRLVREENVADLEVRLAEFANGVRFNFKATTFDADAIFVHVRVGEGQLLQPEDRPGLDVLANTAFMAGGLGRHTAQELSELLAGRAVNVAFHIEPDACVFDGRCARRELPLCLQLIAAYLRDAAYRPDVMREARGAFGSMFASLVASPGGPISIKALRNLAGGDRRFGFPEWDELLSRNLDDVKAWLDPQFQRGAIELSVVGDVTWDGAAAAVASTFGALPPRGPRPDLSAAAKLPRPRPQLQTTVLPTGPQLKQCAIAWYWPVAEIRDARDERRCVLLSAILADRLRVKLREELGAAYSPSATFARTPGFPTLSYFLLYAEVEPARAKQAFQIIVRETTSLAAKGPDADEFARAKPPYLHEMNNYRQTNAYWAGTVLSEAQQHPERIDDARNRAADMAAITQDEIAKLARRNLQPKDSLKFGTAPTPNPTTPVRRTSN